MKSGEIPFIPSDEFDTACERDFALTEIELYADEFDSSQNTMPRHGAESFLLAVEQSRILTVEGEKLLFKRLNFLRFRANALQATAKFQRKTKKA